jgi:hypothetical protein
MASSIASLTGEIPKPLSSRTPDDELLAASHLAYDFWSELGSTGSCIPDRRINFIQEVQRAIGLASIADAKRAVDLMEANYRPELESAGYRLFA